MLKSFPVLSFISTQFDRTKTTTCALISSMNDFSTKKIKFSPNLYEQKKKKQIERKETRNWGILYVKHNAKCKRIGQRLFQKCNFPFCVV